MNATLPIFFAGALVALGCGGTGQPYEPPDAGSYSTCNSARGTGSIVCSGLFDCGELLPGQCCPGTARFYCHQVGCVATEAEAASACAGTGSRCTECKLQF